MSTMAIFCTKGDFEMYSGWASLFSIAFVLLTGATSTLAQEFDIKPCISCSVGGTVSGKGGDNQQYSESFQGNTQICISEYYVFNDKVFVHITKDGAPIRPGWGVTIDSLRANCSN